MKKLQIAGLFVAFTGGMNGFIEGIKETRGFNSTVDALGFLTLSTALGIITAPMFIPYKIATTIDEKINKP